ncbi:UTRA domain-containing protein [Streptomyces sp. 4N509B]|uniref:UTRA domain-containing protein n=1 Tax=Streptomyces sp. 4N509B TaxID=3457413 RepID=UPI003FCFE6FD
MKNDDRTDAASPDPGGSPRRMRRSNERHQWEKDRARRPLRERLRTGAKERDNRLDPSDLDFTIGYRTTEADEELAADFGVPPGTPLLQRRYETRQRHERAAFEISHSWLVRDHIAANPALLDETNEPWPGGTPHQLWTVGIEVARIVERVTRVRPPSPEEARVLGMAPDAAVIVLRKTCEDAAGRVVEVAEVVLPGDRTELVFVTPLAPWDAEDAEDAERSSG